MLWHSPSFWCSWWCQCVVTQPKPRCSCCCQCVVIQPKLLVFLLVSVCCDSQSLGVLAGVSVLWQPKPRCSCWCQCVVTAKAKARRLMWARRYVSSSTGNDIDVILNQLLHNINLSFQVVLGMISMWQLINCYTTLSLVSSSTGNDIEVTVNQFLHNVNHFLWSSAGDDIEVTVNQLLHNVILLFQVVLGMITM